MNEVWQACGVKHVLLLLLPGAGVQTQGRGRRGRRDEGDSLKGVDAVGAGVEELRQRGALWRGAARSIVSVEVRLQVLRSKNGREKVGEV